MYAIYIYRNSLNKVIYVGLSENVRSRHMGHRQDTWFNQAKTIDVAFTENIASMKIWEKYYISIFQPNYNIKDNKVGRFEIDLPDLPFVRYNSKKTLPGEDEMLKDFEKAKKKNPLEFIKKEENEELKSKCLSQTKELATANKRISELQRGKYGCLKREIRKDYKDEIKALKQELQNKDSQIVALQKRIEDGKSITHQQYLKIREQQQEIDTYLNQSSALIFNLDELKQYVKELESQIRGNYPRDLYREVRSLKKQVSKHLEDDKDLREENSRLRDELRDSEYLRSYESSQNFWKGYGAGRRHY